MKTKQILQELNNKNYKCPQCESKNILPYFVDEDLNEIAPNDNELSQQGKCNDCLHTDELHFFKN